jgi:serine protease
MNAMALATAMVFSGAATAGGPDSRTGRVLVDAVQAGQTYDRFIVKFSRDSASRNSVSARLNVLNSAGRGVGLRSVQELRETATGAQVIATDRRLTADEVSTFLRGIDGIEYAEIDRLNKPMLTPNDPSYGQQWGYNDSDAGIRANEAWDVATGAGVVVAVLDTGITSHPDLNANVIAGYDFIADTAVSNDGNGRDNNPADPGDWVSANQCGQPHAAQGSSWHGTHVAGTIAAVTNNGVGVAGTAFNAKIMPLRVLGTCGGYDSDIADAIIWASGGSVSGVPANPNPAEVINLSLGGSGACGATTQAAINIAVGNGTTLAIAAGNDNINVSNASPANCANVIAVASTTNTGSRSSFSNYGNLIDIAAPGSSITSTLNSGATTPGTSNYASYSGTSMATPHVAGVIALAQSIANPAKTPAQMEALIKAQFRTFPVTPSQTIGPGILDAKKVVDAVNGGGGNTAPVASFTFSSSGLTASFTDGSTDPGGSIASRAWNFGDGTTSTAANPSKTYSAAGTYTVTLTVTDNGGLTNTTTRSVTVSTGGGGGTVLSNGVAVTGLAATTGNSLNYTMVVPAGASGLKFVTSGGTGDMDMYVKFGSAPTDSSYDCRPYANGNAETCNIATAQAGTYYVRLKAYSSFTGLSLTGSYTTGGGGGAQTYSNGTDYAVGDNTTVDSPITVSGRSGNAPSNASVTVAIVHTYQGDLKVDLVAPDGSLYNIHNRTGAGTDNVNKTVSLNLSSEALNGTWKLRVNDNAGGDTGYINSWSVTF